MSINIDKLSGELSLKKESVFKQLFKTFFPRACLYASSIIKDKEASADIVQEIFIRMWEKKLKFPNQLSFKAYLYYSVKNTCINYLRDKKDKLSIDNLQEIESSAESIENLLIEAEISSLVLEAILSLPESRRNVILLKIEGMSIEEIAQELNLSANTVKAHRKIAYKDLRKTLRAAVYIFL